LEDFKANITAIQSIESQYLQHHDSENKEYSTDLSKLNEQFAQASANLHQLSHIQVKEGMTLNDQSQRIVNYSSLLTSLEMVMLVCIAIILQVIVLASQPVISRQWQQSSLN